MTRTVRRSLELYDIWLADLGGETALSPMDRTFLAQACRLMARAEECKEPFDAVRLSNAAARMLGNLRDRDRRREPIEVLVPGTEYLTLGKPDAPTARNDSAVAVGESTSKNNAPSKRGRPKRPAP
jgi:hypothetical protein